MKPRSFGFWSTFLIRNKKGRKKNSFLRINTSMILFNIHSLLSVLGWTTNAQVAKESAKVFLRAKKTQMLGHGENRSIYLRKKELCDPEGYLRICFKSLTIHSALFNSDGSAVLLHTLLHLSEVTLTLLIYFSDHIFHSWKPLLTTSELQTVALTPGSPCTAVTHSSHLHHDAFCVWLKPMHGRRCIRVIRTQCLQD